MRYGFTDDEWQVIERLVRETLVERVRMEVRPIPYSELTEVTVGRLGDRPALAGKTREILRPDAHALADMLGEISTESCNGAPDRGMLSVVVVHKRGDMRPGKGFFECAVTLGRLRPNASDDEKETLWIRELDLVRRGYS
jgi:hypothetical protein